MKRISQTGVGCLAAGLLAVGVSAVVSTSGATAAGNDAAPVACVTDIDKVIATKPTAEMTTASLPADLVAKLDAAAAASFKEAATPGAIVGVRTPHGTWTAAYGKADHDTGAPMEVGMHTRIGSVTKPITGTVILQLAEAGKLSLDDPISKYVPGVPNGDKIPLLLLANMTSGVASYTRNPKFLEIFGSKPETILTPDQLIAWGIEKSPAFAPGAEFDYSNTNTILLGKVIEKVTGEDVGAVITEMIIEPLKLANTSWPGTSTAMPAPFAQGYTLQGDAAKPDAPANATHWNPAWGWTAGEVISDIDDLLIFGRALGTGQGLLGHDMQAKRLSFPNGNGYGIAWGCIDGWVGHTGELPGYNTTLYYDTTTDTTVAVQTNSDIPSGDCAVSTVLTDDPRDQICSSPATRIFAGVSTALGHPFNPLPKK